MEKGELEDNGQVRKRGEEREKGGKMGVGKSGTGGGKRKQRE